MHDTDRIAMEYGPSSYEGSDYEHFNFESVFDGGSGEGVFDEIDEIDLASQFLEVQDEGQLDQFIGDVFRKAASVAGAAIKSPVGQALGGMLKGAVKRHAPSLGGALGGRIAGPAGARIGSQVASGLISALGLEVVEAGEDQEFAAARRFVRTAGQAAVNAARAVGIDPREAARRALAEAAKKFLPGLFGEVGAVGAAGGGGGIVPSRGGQSGRWIRRGNRVVLLGI